MVTLDVSAFVCVLEGLSLFLRRIPKSSVRMLCVWLEVVVPRFDKLPRISVLPSRVCDVGSPKLRDHATLTLQRRRSQLSFAR